MRAKTTEEFIKEAIKVYGKNRYGYDKAVYVNTYTKVKIDCLVCGITFEQRPNSHLAGHAGCSNCVLSVVHGLSYHPFYRVWINIKARCLNPKDKSYKNYGGRGIQIFEEWKDNPKIFIEWVDKNLETKPTPQHSLDRINNDGNYEPGNLRWATRKEQKANQTKPNQRKIENLEKQIEEQNKIIEALKTEIKQLNEKMNRL